MVDITIERLENILNKVENLFFLLTKTPIPQLEILTPDYYN